MKPLNMVALVLGLGAFSNGLLMLRDPLWWYGAIPTVPTTGPFNQHFVRDIGIMYAMCGAGFVLGALVPAHRTAAWVAATAFLGLHACLHVWETLVGICAPSTFVEDLPAVVAPALIGLVLVACCVRPRLPSLRSA
jgi:hypothetical protein